MLGMLDKWNTHTLLALFHIMMECWTSATLTYFWHILNAFLRCLWKSRVTSCYLCSNRPVRTHAKKHCFYRCLETFILQNAIFRHVQGCSGVVQGLSGGTLGYGTLDIIYSIYIFFSFDIFDPGIRWHSQAPSVWGPNKLGFTTCIFNTFGCYFMFF